MKRTFNYTGRRKIERRDINILIRKEGELLAFDAVLQLTNYKFPGIAQIYVEAYRQNQWMQFSFGTVGAVRPPANRLLTEYAVPEGLLFRIRVVLPTGSEKHKLLGEADQIPFVKAGTIDDHRRPIITPESADLDRLLWKLDLEGEIPRLLVNEKTLPTWRDFARNPLFIALVYPEVLRQTLNRALIEDKFTEDDEGDETANWRQDWVAFARQLGGLGPLPNTNETERRLEWIDDAVNSFARRHDLKQLADDATGGSKLS